MTDTLELLRSVKIGELRTVHYRVERFDYDMNAKVFQPFQVSGVITYVGLDTVAVRVEDGGTRYIITSYINNII